MRLWMLFFGWLLQLSPSDQITATLSNINPYVGEPIIYTVNMRYLPEGEKRYRLPGFIGFAQETSEPNNNTEIINGLTFATVTQQVTLYPLQVGTFTLEPASIQLNDSPFQPNNSLNSEAFTLVVQPLPQPIPPDFGGAIGSFEISATVDKTTLDADESLVFSLSVAGLGNLTRLKTPMLDFGPAWWSIPRSIQESGSSRIFSYFLLPQQNGNTEVPALTWSFLNPRTGQYEQRLTPPFAVIVSGEVTPIPQGELPSVSAILPQTPLNSVPARFDYGLWWLNWAAWIQNTVSMLFHIALVGLAGFLLLVVLLLRARLRRFKLMLLATLCLLTVLTAPLALRILLNYQYPEARIIAEAAFYSGPGNSYLPFGVFEPGQTVRIMATSDAWAQLRASDGQAGWVQLSALGVNPVP